MDFHPLAEVYPLMPDSERAVMTEDMRASGYDPRFPIVLHEGQILDGRNRWLSAEEAGVEPVLVELPAGQDPEAFVRRANEHRRHLAQEWLQKRRQERIARVAEARQEGKSLRAIAEQENISVAQVSRDIDEVTVPGGTVTPAGGVVTGKDGRQQPASKPKPLCERCKRVGEVKDCDGCKALRTRKKPAEASGTAAAREPPPPPPEPTDALGLPVPKESRESFAALAAFDEMAGLIKQAEKVVGKLAEAPGGECFRALLTLRERNGKQSFRWDRLHDLLGFLQSTRPHAARCPYCLWEGRKKNHRDCNACKGMPYVTESCFRNLPDEVRAAADAYAKGGAA